MPKWVTPYMAVKGNVDKHPVKRGVEGHKYRLVRRGNMLFQPVLKLLHGHLRRQTIPRQFPDRKPADRQGLRSAWRREIDAEVQALPGGVQGQSA